MLPEKFKQRMMRLLGEEYPDFERALLEGAAERAIRANPLKGAGEEIIGELKIDGEPIPYVKGGYFLPEGAVGIGNTPTHHSGKIYVQDPGAMASAAALDIKEDMWVADLCAAPGGKSTQAAAFLGEGGFILSNEYVPKRAKILVGNFERMGIRNGMVTSLDTARLGELFDSVFDIVIADAPCSGEGMFRKEVPAIEEWSEENVIACKARQTEILSNAAGMVKEGGELLYSTCTYSLSENEEVIDEFLASHPDFRLREVPKSIIDATACGIQFEGARTGELHLCRRFYPHKSRGEGQFLALMERVTAGKPKINFRDSAKPLSAAERNATDAFFRENLIRPPRGRVAKHGSNLVLIPHECPIPSFGVFSAGVLLGELRGSVLVPSHQFFSAYGELFLRREIIDDEKRAEKYLRGEEIDAESFKQNGF